MKTKVVLGIDFGSTAVRVLTMDLESGKVLNSEAQGYEQGVNGVFTSDSDSLLARQSADDYILSMKKALGKIKAKNQELGIEMSAVSGIGIDSTGSTPLPITKDMNPLSSLAEFNDNLNAYAWMWKDHTSHREADFITEIITEKSKVSLKLRLNCMAVMTGITINAPIRRIPTTLIDKDTVIAAKTKMIRLNFFAFMPFTIAISSSKDIKNNSL